MKLSICFTVDSVEFTAAVIRGDDSLGGSESACLGLARALKARGHTVHIFTTKLGADAPAVDHAGVGWHPLQRFVQVSLFHDWDVHVALRMPGTLGTVPAKFRVLWSQDLMSAEAMKQHVMGCAWAYDAVAYASRYHRHQWETLVPELAPIGYVTRNGFDPALVPTSVTKRLNRIIHISRPERGLDPILKMWPQLKAQEPDAELAICRYSSMYDAGGWGQVCAQYDRRVDAMNQELGGIVSLGELGKPALYKAIAEAAVMWYPGVSTFGETSCIAAIEAQACGTPFVGSYKGALAETVPSGVLIKGVAESDPVYHAASVQAVRYALEGCRRQTFGYRQAQQQGRKHVETYTYDAIAAEWEAWLLHAFNQRYQHQKAGVLERLLHTDDHTRAAHVAEEILTVDPDNAHAIAALERCDRVIAGLDHTADNYADHAWDPQLELARGGARMASAVSLLAGKTRVLDAACGSGAFALALAQADPNRTVVALDYAEGNILAGRKAAAEMGLADRIQFLQIPIWDYADQMINAEFDRFLDSCGSFDGLWCGEFLEHVAGASLLIDALESVVKPGGMVVFSAPFGPTVEDVPRDVPLHLGHVHHFQPSDLDALFGQKPDYRLGAIPWQERTAAGSLCGNWIISYTASAEAPTGDRPIERRILTRPYARVTAGLIVNDTLDLRRCLDAVWPVVDEIVLGDTGCRPGELEQIAQEFPRKVRIIQVQPVHEQADGFAGARNAVLAEATGDWFLWIDADETLCGGADLGKYRDAVVYRGFSIKQQHLQLDGPLHADTPVRFFRRGPDIQFYGCVHEQPQMGDCNGDIVPCLLIHDVQLAHVGYLHESLRRQKALGRNLPLLTRDQERFPDRVLGKVLVIREHANLALWGLEASGGVLTDGIKQHQALVIGLYEESFMDPANKFHGLARPFYESTLRHMKGAIELEIGVGGAEAPDGLGPSRVKADRTWVRTPAHIRQVLAYATDQMLKPKEHPDVLDVEPFIEVAVPVEVSA